MTLTWQDRKRPSKIAEASFFPLDPTGINLESVTEMGLFVAPHNAFFVCAQSNFSLKRNIREEKKKKFYRKWKFS